MKYIVKFMVYITCILERKEKHLVERETITQSIRSSALENLFFNDISNRTLSSLL